jgi:hypothetical protein
MPQDFTLPELDETLASLPYGALHHITRSDFERLFGVNDVGTERLRNFAKGHACVASFADHLILFRKKKSGSHSETPALDL